MVEWGTKRNVFYLLLLSWAKQKVPASDHGTWDFCWCLASLYDLGRTFINPVVLLF